MADQAAGEALLTSGEIDALVTAVSPRVCTSSSSRRSTRRWHPLFGTLAQQFALVDSVEALGGDPAEVTGAIALATPEITSLEPEPEVDGGQIAAGYVAGILLFIALMTLRPARGDRESSRRSPAASSNCFWRRSGRGS